ncbi:hypothetical protein Pcinc_024802, partial [Petrolisthes cinctipes]
TSLLDPQRELSYIFQDHLNTGTKLLPVSRGYYFIPGGKGQRLPLPLCISGQHKSVFHDLFCSIANSPLQSLTFLYPSLYLSVGDLVCLGDCVRRSKHLTRLKLRISKALSEIALKLSEIERVKVRRSKRLPRRLCQKVVAFDPTPASKSQKHNMDRTAPLSQTQRMALLNLIKERDNIVNNKSTAPGIIEAKKRTWEEIILKFNALNPDQQPRSSKQLKRSYDHVKRK